MNGSSSLHALALVVISSAVIILLRATPFIVMAVTRKSSKDAAEAKWIKVAEKWLSPVMIAFLVLYSYSSLELRTVWPYLAGAVVVILQLIFRNGLVSVLVGTAIYMLAMNLA